MRWQVAVRDALVLCEENAVLLAKDAIEPVPPAEMRQRFYSPYFIIPKKGSGLRPILDLRISNRALLKLPFKILTQKRIIRGIQPQDWFAAVDLKDAYFHVSIHPRRRPFLRFAFEGVGHGSTGSSPSGSPCPLVSLHKSRRAPLPCYGKWASGSSTVSSMACVREQLCDHRDLVLRHLSQLGLRVNWEKSKLSPVQRNSFLSMELDSVSVVAHLTNEHAQSVLNLSSLRGRMVVPLKHLQRLLGHMASAAAVSPLRLLHMGPLQHSLHS